MNISYFINKYPKVSYSFIRREILMPERQGYDVQPIAIPDRDGDAVDEVDIREFKCMQCVLQHGLVPLLRPMLNEMLMNPIRFISALMMAFKMGWISERSLPCLLYTSRCV